MSEETEKKNEAEVKSEEVVVEKKGFASWVKNAISAIIGALLSFGVTMGIVTTEQEKVMNEKLGEINKKSESIVEDLKAGKVKEAMETAKAISADTKEVVETGKQIKEQAKEAVDNVKEKINNVKTAEEVKKTEAVNSNY